MGLQSCTEDTCACAASAQTVTCMNCVLGEATTAQGTTVTNGFTSAPVLLLFSHFAPVLTISEFGFWLGS